MKNFLKKTTNLFLIIMIVLYMIPFKSLAIGNDLSTISKAKITDEFKNYLKLSDEQKANTFMPTVSTVSDITKTMKTSNVLSVATNLGTTPSNSIATADDDRFDLRDYISNNLVVRNQESKSLCWAFASLGEVETNLGLKNYFDNNNTTAYDFSEQHMDYANTYQFKDNRFNIYGTDRAPGSSSSLYSIMNYFTNGLGIVNESDMPYTDSEEQIDIDELYNKNKYVSVNDVVFYGTQLGQSKENVINSIKDHLIKYGGLTGMIYGDSYTPGTTNIYVSDGTTNAPNHAVLIVGWDDSYDANNFTTDSKPANNGAWIIKNSWGTNLSYTQSQMKQMVFDKLQQTSPDVLTSNGYTSADQLPIESCNTVFENMGFTITAIGCTTPVGDDGFMYVSYDDANVNKCVLGLKNVEYNKTYDNVYLYDETGTTGSVLTTTVNTVNVAQKFNKKTLSGTEYIKQVGVFVPQACNVKVRINLEDDSITSDKLNTVTLETGDSIDLDFGYHIIKFKTPVELTNNKFSVSLEFTSLTDNNMAIPYEAKVNQTLYKNVVTEREKCYLSYNALSYSTTWYDMGNLAELSSNSLPDCDSEIRVYTSNSLNNDNNNNENGNNNGSQSNENGEGSQTDDNNQPDEIQNNVVPIKFLNNVTTNVSNIKVYNYEDATKNNSIINLEIDNIERSNQNDYSIYYYYLSTDPNLTNINDNDFVKITEDQTYLNKLKFTINTNDIKDIDKLAEQGNLYIYIREFSRLGESTKITDSEAIKVNSTSNVEIYENDVIKKEAKTNEEIKNIANEVDTKTNSKDETTAKKSIPQTGENLTFYALIGTAVITVIMFMIYRKYKIAK